MYQQTPAVQPGIVSEPEYPVTVFVIPPTLFKMLPISTVTGYPAV